MRLVHIPYNQEFLAKLYQLRHIFPEKRKRWVGYDNIRLFQQFNALFTPEITISLKISNADFVGIWYSVAILVAKVFKPNSALTVILTEKITLLIFITSGNKTLQPKIFKFVGKIMEKVRASRIITIAEDSLSIEVLPVMANLFLYVRQLRIKFILLLPLRILKAFVPTLRHFKGLPSHD